MKLQKLSFSQLQTLQPLPLSLVTHISCSNAKPQLPANAGDQAELHFVSVVKDVTYCIVLTFGGLWQKKTQATDSFLLAENSLVNTQ